MSAPDGPEVVYTPNGKVAHLLRHGDEVQDGETYCGKQAPADGWRGTGTQDEWDRAGRLPICKWCQL